MIGEELFISAGSQISVFISACLVGAKIAVVYECFRLIRCIFSHCELAVAVEDVLFCVLAAIYSFNFWLYASKGELRGFIIVGEWLGAAAYFLTVGRLVSKAERLLNQRIQIVVLRVSITLNRVKKALFIRKNKLVKLKRFTSPEKEKNHRVTAKTAVFDKVLKFIPKKRKIKDKTS